MEAAFEAHLSPEERAVDASPSPVALLRLGPSRVALLLSRSGFEPV